MFVVERGVFLVLARPGDFSCRAWASPCGGFSCCGAQALGAWASVVALWRVGSSWTRDQTRVLCMGRQILNQWTTRQVQLLLWFGGVGWVVGKANTGDYGNCWGSLNAGWKRISRHRAFQKGVKLLRTKSKDKVGTVSTVGRPPDRLGKADSFHGLIANFYSFKTKKIPAGRLVLGDWLGHYREWTSIGSGHLLEWASLPNWESGSLLVMIRGFWQGYKGAQSASGVNFILGSASVALV